MAKIVYGVAGQGFGHSTRSKEILKHLASQGHQILVPTYGQALFFLDKEFEVLEIPGLILHYEHNRLRYRKTVYKNAKLVLKQTKEWRKILKQIGQFKPDLFITDFEPLTALAAKAKRRPLISIDNQHQLSNCRIDLPSEYRRDLTIDKMVVKSMIWGARYYLVTSFFETPIIRKNTFLLPPILRQEILDLQPKKGDYFLVYQTSNFDWLIKVLENLGEKFVVFGVNREGTEGNIEFKNYSSHEWLNYLSNCKAVIGTAGLSLITECLHLKKPYLAIPIKKQIEQVVNAYYLEQKGFGAFTYRLTEQDFKDFSNNLSLFESNLAQLAQEDNSKIFCKLDELIKQLVNHA